MSFKVKNYINFYNTFKKKKIFDVDPHIDYITFYTSSNPRNFLRFLKETHQWTSKGTKLLPSDNSLNHSSTCWLDISIIGWFNIGLTSFLTSHICSSGLLTSLLHLWDNGPSRSKRGRERGGRRNSSALFTSKNLRDSPRPRQCVLKMTD